MEYVLLYDNPVYGTVVAPLKEFEEYFDVKDGCAVKKSDAPYTSGCWDTDKWLLSYSVGEARGWRAGKLTPPLNVAHIYYFPA